MHPEIAHWGFVHVRSYGVMMVVAFLVGTWIALREARRLRLDEDKLVAVIFIALVSAVLGARALYVVEHVDEFRQQWFGLLALWQGGLTLYGGSWPARLPGCWRRARPGCRCGWWPTR